MTFAMQIGLVRESVTVEGGNLTMETLKEIACAFVDRRVSTFDRCWLQNIFVHYDNVECVNLSLFSLLVL